MPSSLLSIAFIFLWSSAFISAKAIMADATAFAALALRFGIVGIGFWLIGLFFSKNVKLSRDEFFHSAITGMLLHGFYLGGVFWALSHGMQATIAALIISLQPVFTALLAGPLLKEQITALQWIGIILGFVGTLIVIGFDIGKTIPIAGLIICFLALAAAITGTLYQKKFGQNIPLLPANKIQAYAAALLHLILLSLFETPSISLTSNFIIGMSWQIFAVSFAAYIMLLILLARGTASQTSSLLFLIAPVAAVQGWAILGEHLSQTDIAGLFLASIGVFLATRQKRAKAMS